MLYSKQTWFCNACGKEQHSELPNAIGREGKCCSLECHRELNWRETLSIMGQTYKPRDKSQER